MVFPGRCVGCAIIAAVLFPSFIGCAQCNAVDTIDPLLRSQEMKTRQACSPFPEQTFGIALPMTAFLRFSTHLSQRILLLYHFKLSIECYEYRQINSSAGNISE